MTTAELIVRTLDLARGDLPMEDELDSPQILWSDKIKALYSKYKSQGLSFATCAARARVEVVEEILGAMIGSRHTADLLSPPVAVDEEDD